MIGGLSISAVLFVFNEEKYLPTMLDSILDQTEKVDAIIVVDDYSTDGTKGIVEEYTLSYPEIIYCLSKEKGKVYALETGLNLVKTDLFFVCAGDDKLLPYYTNHMHQMLEDYNIDFCYAKYFETDQKLRKPKLIEKKTFYKKDELLIHNRVAGGLFAKTKILKGILPFPKGLLFEDWFISLTLTAKYERAYVSRRPVCLYRRHAKSATTLKHSKSKYTSLIERDISFYEVLLASRTMSILNDGDREIIINRILFYRSLLDYSLLKMLSVVRRRGIKFHEVLKGLFFPIFVKLKYTRS